MPPSRWVAPARVRKGCALGLLLAVLACERPGAAGAGPATEPARPPRVVSLAPVASDLLLALGASASLVGVDRESQGLPGLGGLPVVELADAVALEPDLVLVPRLPPADEAPATRLRAAGSELVEVAPHDLDDAFALCRSLGSRLVGSARAEAFLSSLGTQLAQISGASFGRVRPRIAAVVAVEPFELAGGHSFATDLIEIAGGRSVTHELEEQRIPTSGGDLLATAPDLVLMTGSELPSRSEQERLRSLLGAAPRLVFFAFDSERFWVRDAVEVARRLRALVEPLSRELERSGPSQSSDAELLPDPGAGAPAGTAG